MRHSTFSLKINQGGFILAGDKNKGGTEVVWV